MKRRINFTLVEILLVTGIICLIVALIMVGYNGVYRSWATKNTIATMKNAHLALDRCRLENGAFPDITSGNVLQWNKNEKLGKDLLQDCAPYAIESGSNIVVIDDFGNSTNSYIRYIFPVNGSFALISAGKDGVFNSAAADDIIYLPNGNGSNLAPGFYMAQITSTGTINSSSADIEPLAK